MNTATSFVYVANSLPCGPCGPVAPGCGRASRCGRVYAQEDSQQADAACHSELLFIEPSSEQAQALQAEQEQAARDLADDLLAAEADAAAQNNSTIAAPVAVEAN